MSGQPVGLFSPTTARLQTCFSSCLTLTIMVLLLPNEGGEGERNGCVYLMESQRFLPRHVDTSALSFIAPIRKHPPPPKRVTSCLRWRGQLLLKRINQRPSFPSLPRARLLRLGSCQLVLLDPPGLHRGRPGQGVPQGCGGPGHHVGHRRLRLQRLRLPHGPGVSTLGAEREPGCC